MTIKQLMQTIAKFFQSDDKEIFVRKWPDKTVYNILYCSFDDNGNLILNIDERHQIT